MGDDGERVRVKICGLTNLADARTAVAAGADLLGFIFYPPSPRAVSVLAAREIVAALRADGNCPTLVGVFVSEPPRAVAALLDEVGLDLAQLSGDEPPVQLFDESSPLFGRAFKALRPASREEAEAEVEWFAPPGRGERPSLLLDAYHPTLRGGTGRTADWALAHDLAQAVPGLMLAGGLTPDNVAQAIAAVRPWAVDVASGVESEPGRKDERKVREFVERVGGWEMANGK